MFGVLHKWCGILLLSAIAVTPQNRIALSSDRNVGTEPVADGFDLDHAVASLEKRGIG